MTYRRSRIWGVFSWIVLVAASTALAQQSQEEKLTRQQADRAVQIAEERAKDGKIAEAGGFYLAVVNSFPERHDIRLRLARIYYQLNDYDNAARSFKEAAENLSGADQAEGYLMASSAFVKQALYSDAIPVGRKAVELNPTSAAAHVNLALSLAKTGELQEAAQLAEKALQIEPNNAVAHATLGEAHLAGENFDAAEASFRKAIQIDSNNAEAQAGLADIEFRKGNWDAAIDAATKALDLNSKLTRAYAIRGMSKNNKGDASGATSDLQMALTVNPNDADAQFAYAQVQQRQGSPSMAKSYYRKAIELKPSFYAAHLNLGEILVNEGNYEEAREHLRVAMERMPNSAQAQYLYGVCLSHDKEVDAALQAFDKAIELDNSLAGPHHYRGKVLREQKQDVAGALVELETAIRLDPENTNYLTDYGVALYDGKELDKAIETLEKAAASPDYAHPLGYAYLGVAYKDKQDFAKSAGHFQKAVELIPNWGLPHWGLAWAEFGLIPKGCPCGPEDEERVQRIVEHHQKALELGVNDPGLAERAEALQKGEKVK